MKTQFHPAYGLPNQYRIEAVKVSHVLGARRAAQLFNVHATTVYKWRKVLQEAK